MRPVADSARKTASAKNWPVLGPLTTPELAMPRRKSDVEPDRSTPLLKWAGGKRQLVEVITASLPQKIDTYYEPFVGGGAIFFALSAEGRFRRAVLSDQNSELIETYVAVRDEVDAVLGELSVLPHSEADYYRIRASA